MKMFTIGQIAQMFQLPVSTLRYYDKEGLFPQIHRVSGIRMFSEREVEALRVIECLKKSGMEIKDIKQFMEWCAQGSKTYAKRHDMFVKRKAHVEAEMERLKQTLAMLEYKCWYYEQALQDGNEERLHAITPQEMPDAVQKAYRLAHQNSI